MASSVVHLRRLVDIFASGLYNSLHRASTLHFERSKVRKCCLHQRSAKIKPLLGVNNKIFGAQMMGSYQVKYVLVEDSLHGVSMS